MKKPTSILSSLLFLILFTSAQAQKEQTVQSPPTKDILKDASDFLEDETKEKPKTRFRVNFSTELFTDDNVQSLNSKAVTPVSLAHRVDSGVGNDLSLSYDFLKGKDRSFVAFLSASSFEHFRSSTRDQQALKGGFRVLLPLGDQSGEETWNFQGETSYGSVWLNNINFRDSLDLKASVIFRENAQNKTTFSYASNVRDFTQPNSDLRLNRDGVIHLFGLSHNWNPAGWYTLPGQDAGFTLGIGRVLERTDGGFFNNDSTQYSLSLNFPIASRDKEVIGTTTLSTVFSGSKFDSPEQLQITGFGRQDNSFGINARTDFKLSDLYSVYLEYDRSNFDTNLPLTNFKRNRIFLGASLRWGK